MGDLLVLSKVSCVLIVVESFDEIQSKILIIAYIHRSFVGLRVLLWTLSDGAVGKCKLVAGSTIWS